MTVNRSRCVAMVVFLSITALVAGGLAWATRQALQLEHADTVRLALWRLDSRIFPVLAREDSRPVSHYEPLYPPVPALDRKGQQIPLGAVLLPSPLLNAELPDWLALHFVVDSKLGWRSPQVPDDALAERLKATPAGVSIINATPARRERLQEFAKQMPPSDWFGESMPDVPSQQGPSQSAEKQPLPGTRGGRMPQVAAAPAEQWLQNESEARGQQQTAVLKEGKNYEGNNPPILNRMQTDLLFKDSAAAKAFTCATAQVEDMLPQWRRGRNGEDYLLLVRNVQSDGPTFVQGVAFDWPKLRDVLLQQISDLLPHATLAPMINDQEPGYSMKAIPVVLVGGDAPMTIFPLDSPLRWGLGLAWAAALLALGVVALTGWSLLDLSERRFRFVTAVTHELRTPLTTLRLYLDMLTGGMVREEKQRSEYLNTLHGEADRLHRLIGNVLDFARLERQQPVVNRRPLPLRELLETVRSEWEGHCKSAGKELTLDIADDLPPEINTDPDLCRQLIGNLLDNACKYSAGATDPRVWLRAKPDNGNVVFEVEDRGPGVPSRESRSVFRAFRRGQSAPTTAGGVGLGLALADRWAKLLGGHLGLKAGNGGACFQFIHPVG
jgi:signal transduction histidine kinase